MEENPDTTEQLVEVPAEPTPPEKIAVDSHECQYPDGLEHCIICGKPIEKDAPPQAEIVSDPTPTPEIPTPITEGVANEGMTTPTPGGVAIPTDNVAPAEVTHDPIDEPEDDEKNGGEIGLSATERRSYRWWEEDNGVKIERLRNAFLMGCDIGEACLYSEITRDQFEYYSESIDKNYRKKVKVWRENPTLIARKTVTDAIVSNADLALKYLERRKKDEFGLRTEVTGNEGVPLQMVIDIVKQKQETTSE